MVGIFLCVPVWEWRIFRDRCEARRGTEGDPESFCRTMHGSDPVRASPLGTSRVVA